MVKIYKISKASANGEVDATTKAINILLLKDNWSDDTFLSITIKTLDSLHTSLNEVIEQGKAESVLEDKDMARNKVLSELFNFAKGFASVDEPAGDSARRVMNILNKHELTKVAALFNLL
ncbi:MAG: hypothetical protein ACK5L5_02315 [Bacteroidales bacterium]